MNKTNLLLVIIILSAAFFCASGVASAISLNDKYVGNTVVDLEWSKYGSDDFSKYKLYRGDAPIHTESNRDTIFYRDEGPSKGVTYDYKIEVYNATGGLKQSDTESVTTGNVHGTITLGTTWTKATSPYSLTNDVTVNEGVTLTIGNGVTVNSGMYKINVDGTLSPLEGVTFNGKGISVSDADGYSIKNCVFNGSIASTSSGTAITLSRCNNSIISNTAVEHYDGDGIYIYSSSHCTLTDNIASNNRCRGIGLGSSSNCTLRDNIVSNNRGGIDLGSSSNCTLRDNIVSNNRGISINLGSSSNGNTIKNNHVTRIDVMGANHTIDGNTINGSSESGLYIYKLSNFR